MNEENKKTVWTSARANSVAEPIDLDALSQLQKQQDDIDRNMLTACLRCGVKVMPDELDMLTSPVLWVPKKMWELLKNKGGE